MRALSAPYARLPLADHFFCAASHVGTARASRTLALPAPPGLQPPALHPHRARRPEGAPVTSLPQQPQQPRAPGARGPLNCSQNGWRLDQLICKTGVNHLILGPHAGREPRHLLCSEVAAPAACLSGEMEIRRRTKPPRGQAAPSAALGRSSGAYPDRRRMGSTDPRGGQESALALEPVAVCLEATHGSSLSCHTELEIIKSSLLHKLSNRRIRLLSASVRSLHAHDP